MGVIFMTGFETGDMSECGVVNGTISVQSAVARNNGYALYSNANVGASSYGGIRTPGADGKLVNTAAIATSYFRVYIRFAVIPASLEEPFFGVGTTAAGSKIDIYMQSDGTIRFKNSGGTVLDTSSTVFSLDTWYRLEIKLPSGTSVAWEAKIFLGDSLFALETMGATSNVNATGAANVVLGKQFNANNQDIEIYYDDFIWRDDAYPGPGRNVRCVPEANGQYTSGTANGAATLFGCLNQVPPDGDTTYVNGLLVTQAYTADMTACGAGSSVINGVQAFVQVRNLGAGGSLSQRTRSNTTDTDTTAVAATTSYLFYGKVFTTDPATSAAWTVSGVDAVQVGFLETAAGNRCTSAFLMVDFDTTVAGPPVGTLGLMGAGR